jgi:hypothetical protein
MPAQLQRVAPPIADFSCGASRQIRS